MVVSTSRSGSAQIRLHYAAENPITVSAPDFTVSNTAPQSGNVELTIGDHTYVINETKDAAYNQPENRQFNDRASFFETLKADLTPEGAVVITDPTDPYIFYVRSTETMPVHASSDTSKVQIDGVGVGRIDTHLPYRAVRGQDVDNSRF